MYRLHMRKNNLGQNYVFKNQLMIKFGACTGLETVLQLVSNLHSSPLLFSHSANRDPVAKMLGDGFASVEGDDNSTLRLLDQTSKEDGDSADELQTKLRVLLLAQQFDMQLMNQYLKEISQ